jgi:hypothetical protein
MKNSSAASADETLVTPAATITAQSFRSATEAIRRVLEGSTSLEDWDSAFSQVFALHGRAANSDGNEDTTTAEARREYYATLQKWHAQLPRLREWLITQKNAIESRQAHGARVSSWLKAHGQTR